MRRSIFKAGVVTVFGLAIAFAFVSANSSMRHASTAAKAADAVVATPASSDECTSSDVCCAKETKVNTTAVAAAPKKAVARKAAKPVETGPGAAGMVVGIDESGTLTMPSMEQLEELRAGQQTQGIKRATAVRFANGGVIEATELPAEFAQIHIDANGKKIFGHSDNPIPNPAPAKPALEEK